MGYSRAMFGPGIMSVFTSRWKALWWSAGILLTAYCSVPSSDESKQQDVAADASDAKAAQQAMATLDQINNQPGEE